jgi:hypothetical protein
MHASVVMPVLQSDEVGGAAKQLIADRGAPAPLDRRQFLRAGHDIADR